MIVVADTETTDLIQPSVVGLDNQPRIIEFAAIKFNDNFEEISRLQFLCHPGMLVTPETTKLTGITNEMLKDTKSFARHFQSVVDFLLGVRVLITHNIGHDVGCIMFELRRMQKETQFPWPPVHVCTVESSMHLDFPRKSKEGRASLKELYQYATGTPLAQAHRAMDDVEKLVEIAKFLHSKGAI